MKKNKENQQFGIKEIIYIPATHSGEGYYNFVPNVCPTV